MTRLDIENQIERLLSILDAMDRDPDLEPDADQEHDLSEFDAPRFIWGGSEEGGPAHSGK